MNQIKKKKLTWFHTLEINKHEVAGDTVWSMTVFISYLKWKNSDHYFLYHISPSPQLLLQAWPLQGHYFKSKPRSFLYLAKVCQFYEHVYYCNPNDEGPVCCCTVADAGEAPMSCIRVSSFLCACSGWRKCSFKDPQKQLTKTEINHACDRKSIWSPPPLLFSSLHHCSHPKIHPYL